MKRMKTTTSPLTAGPYRAYLQVKLSPALARRVQRLVAHQGVTRSAFLRAALANYIDRHHPPGEAV